MTGPARRLAERNMDLARRAAWSLHRRYFQRLDDVESDALYGLCKAAERFDETRGVPFGPFALSAIVGEIQHGMRDRDERPRGLREDGGRLARAQDALRRDLGREPSPAQIRAKLQWPAERFDECLLSNEHLPLSLDANPVHQLVPDASSVELWDLLDRLPSREREAAVLFAMGFSQREVGLHTGVSAMQAGRRLRSARVSLREAA